MNPPPYTVNDLNDELDELNFDFRGEPRGDQLIIALDFGTTYSGIGYAFTTDPEKVFTIDSWPGGDRIVPKTPTTIRYEPGSLTEFKWGYELDRVSDEKIERLKLLFDPEQPRAYFIPTNVEAETAKLPKATVEVASDYMRAIFQHAIKEIEGNYLDPEFLNNFEKQYVLTVPAVWSDRAKDMTLRAARGAGISPVEMITEPEAAALFTLQTMKNKGLKAKDAVVICDAGGGTVDLIAYEIISLEPFELRGLTKATGGIAGSTMINRLLEDEIQKVVGDEAYVKLKKTDGYRNALKEFDVAIKIAFGGKGDPDKYISFPMANLKDNPSKGLVKNSMTLSGATLFRIFDPIIREIDRLIIEQVNSVKIERLQAVPPNTSGVKAVFLVGGFGSSTYLKEVVQKSNPGVIVMQPREAWSSIVRLNNTNTGLGGAVMSKLPLTPTVVASKAPKHYGTSCVTPWDGTRDRGFPKVKDLWDGRDKCVTMRWFIFMDDELERGKKIKLSFYRDFPGHDPTGDVLRVRDGLYESVALLAPDHPLEVAVNCELTTDLNQVPKSFFVKKNRLSDGAPYTELTYNLQVESNQSGLLKYSFEVDGTEYSAVEASY